MCPNIFVSKDFFDYFEIENSSISKQNIYTESNDVINKLKSLNRIRDLFLASNIYSDISTESAIKHFTLPNGVARNFKEFILHRKLKMSSENVSNGKLYTKQKKENCNKSGFCYFTNNEENECNYQTKRSGKIVIGKNFLQTPFYLNHTFASENTNDKIFQVENLKYPCTGILIMDRYLFQDVDRKPPKIPNLISFLKYIISPELNVKFEIDIITEDIDNNNLYEKKYKSILNELGENISLHIYTTKKCDHDRYLITNYSIFSIGLPFLGNTNVSCNFFPSNNSVEAIKNSYKIWHEKLINTTSLIKNIPFQIGEKKLVWKNDDIEHSIFNI